MLKHPHNPYAKTKCNETASTANAPPAAPKTHHDVPTQNIKPRKLTELEIQDQSKKRKGKASPPALRLFHAFRKSMDLPTEPTYTELEEDNLQMFFLSWGDWVSRRAIPLNFDEDLMPPKGSKSKRCVVPSTIGGYMSEIMQYLRREFNQHEEFKCLKNKQDSAPDWWAPLRASIEKRCDNFQKLYVGDYTFGTEDIRPLYFDLGDEGDLDDDDLDFDDGLNVNETTNFLRRCDLKSVIIRLVREATSNNNNLEKNAWLVTRYDAIGRGGEVKFQSYLDWKVDYHLRCVDTKWKESKTMKIHAMPRIVADSFLQDFFWANGAFAMVENGLMRTPSQVQNGLGNVVFPSLHSIRDDYVADKITAVVRDNIPANVPEAVRKLHSSKSLRKGAITEVSLHPEMNVFSTCARTGHSTKANLDSYLDPMNLTRGLPAAQVMKVSTTHTFVP